MRDLSSGELLHNGRIHRVHRIRGKDGASFIMKSRVEGVPASASYLANELRILERLQGVEGCPSLAEGSKAQVRIVLHDFGGVPLDASGLMGRLDLGNFLALSENLARTVALIHGRGVIHRAIEPSHILVKREDLSLQFLGYGSAGTFVEEPDGDWRPERIAGNPLWISPEQTGRMNRIVDWRADLYSLGAVLYALATGVPPFKADSISKILHAHMARLPEPPSAAAPWMPENLEHILLKLLAKEPDSRYQGAASLARDLGLLRQGLAQGKPVGKIPLPPSDIPARPRPPSRLHGRSQEFQRLSAAFESVGSGGSRQVFVAGRSGTGKSSLIRELRRPTALADGFFIGGKCEQLGQGKPFHAPAAALDRLASLLLDGAGQAFEPLRESLAQRLGAGPAILCAVAPALEALLGPPPSMEESAAPKAQARLVGLTVDFLEAVCSPERPVVLVLDDLQWADAPTLALLKNLLGGTRLEGLLLVGAYRDDEVGPSHPLSALLKRPATPERAPEEIFLENLGSSSVASMLGDMLGSTQTDLPALADRLVAKTGGNPHFTVEMVDLLWREGHLWADIPTAKWRWNAEAIQGSAASSDVADLLARDLGSLPRPTQDALAAMACLGSEGDLGTLSLATGSDLPQTAALLEPALAAGVLATSDTLAFQTHDSSAPLRFCHDRMQQAALRFPPAETLVRLRFDIARRLSEATGRADLESKAAWCYSHALDLLDGETERTAAREVFLRAAGPSLASGDYANAETLLRQALGLLPPDAFETHRDECFQILARLHLACYCRGVLDDADRVYQQLEETAGSPADLALPACTQVMSLSNRTRYGDAVRLGCDLAEKLLGLSIPRDNLGDALPAEMRAFQKLVESGGLDLLEKMLSPGESAWNLAARILNRMIPAAFFTSPQLACWLALRCGREWMEHGYRPAFLYPMSCAMLATIALEGDYSTGWRAASRALRIGQSREGGVETARSEHVFGLFGCHWFEPLENSLAHARSAFDTLSRTDELEFACFTFFTTQAALLETCEHLESMRREVAAAMEFARTTGNLHATQSFLAFQQTVCALEGATTTPGGFDNDAFREEAHLGEIASNPMALAFFHTYRAFTACLFHDAPAQDRHAEQAVALLPYITGFYPAALAIFLHSLALVERLREGRDVTGSERRLADHQRWLAARAGDQPANFAHLRDLVEAERLDAIGRPLEAFAMFEKARTQALSLQRPWHLAIATERAARCFERHGLTMASRPLFADALELHQRLGAHGKAASLIAEWTFLRQTPLQSATTEPDHSLANAFQSLAEQETPEALAERAAHWLAEFTGATDVRILTPDSGSQWMLLTGLSGTKTLPPMVADEAIRRGLLSETALSLGTASSAFLISNNAKDDERFLRDPYFQDLPVSSLLVLPVVIHSKIRALAVLENRCVTSAFQHGIVESARILCSQLALSLGNIRNRQALEGLVARRTTELRASQEQLHFVLNNLPVAVATTTLDSKPGISFLNESFTRFFGYTLEDIPTVPDWAVLAYPDETYRHETFCVWDATVAKAVETSGSVESMEFRVTCKNGEVKDVLISAIVLKDRLLVSFVDVTGRRRAEERAHELEEAHRLDLRKKLKTALTASAIAHEIYQPLGRLILTAGLLRNRAAAALRKNSDLSRFVSALTEDAQLTAKIIGKMKALLRNVKTEHETIDLTESVRDAVLYSSPRFRADKVEIVLEEPEERFCIQGDADQIALALNNLLENAAHALITRPIPPAREILIQLVRHSAEIEIRIGDSGPGIPEAEMPDLLLRSTKAEGSGLGLFIVQATMENHYGRLEIGRSPLGGAEFRMVFPVYSTEKPEA